MRSYDANVEIEAPPEQVFPFLVEPERLRVWVGGFVESRPLTEGGARLGARSVDVVEENGRRLEFLTEIRCFEPNRRLEVTIDAPMMDAVSDFRLEPQGDRTSVAYHHRARYKGVLRLLGPFLGGVVRRKLQEDLTRLRAAVEAERRRGHE